MKKTSKIISVFILFVTVFCCSFFVKNTKVKANDEQIPDCSNSQSADKGRCLVTEARNGNEVLGNVIIENNGKIIVSYKYGYTEVLLYVSSENKGMIIHASGNYTKASEIGFKTKEIDLSNYFEVGEEVVIEHISVDFMADKNVGNTGAYTPIYCNVDGGITNCGYRYGDKNIARSELKISKRIENFQNYINGLSNNNLEKIIFKENIEVENDGRGLVFKGPKGSTTANPDNVDRLDSSAGVRIIIQKVQLENMDEGISEIIFDIVIPALLIILGIAGTVVSTVLGYQIIKSADEPQERQDKIKHLKSIIIGIIAVFILLVAAEPVTNLVKEYLLEDEVKETVNYEENN